MVAFERLFVLFVAKTRNKEHRNYSTDRSHLALFFYKGKREGEREKQRTGICFAKAAVSANTHTEHICTRHNLTGRPA